MNTATSTSTPSTPVAISAPGTPVAVSTKAKKRTAVPDAWPTWPFTQLEPEVMQALLKKLKAKDDKLVIATAGDAPF